MKQKTRLGLSLLCGACLACSASSNAPQVPPVGTLGPRPAAPALTALAVVYAGPQGEAVLGSSIQLLFNQALRPAEAATATPPPALELEPAVPGEWQWLGSRALTFFPSAGRLPAATAFHVSYGVNSVPLVVHRPLTVRPALPRSLRAGDRLQASAIVTQLGAQRGPVKVTAEVSGATLHGPAERQLELGSDGSAEVRFELTASAPGELRVRFSASSSKARDQVEVTRKITAPLALEASALYGRTEQAEAQQLGDLSGLRTDVGGIELELASTALVGLESGLQSLSEYPYACTEQLASRLLPLGRPSSWSSSWMGRWCVALGFRSNARGGYDAVRTTFASPASAVRVSR